MPKIGLDAGHGGADSGTYTCSSKTDHIYEKDLTLELVLMVDERLRHNGFETALTRKDDTNPGNASWRGNFFVNNKCDFGLSIHFNGVNIPSAKGAEVFVPYAESVGKIEAEIMTGLQRFFKLRNPVARSNNYYDRNETTDKKLDFSTGKFGTVVTSKKDYFGVIRNAWAGGVSADLLEICFVTNRSDYDTYLANKAAIADVIAGGIVRAYRRKYVPLESGTPPENNSTNENCKELQAKYDALLEKYNRLVQSLKDLVNQASAH